MVLCDTSLLLGRVNQFQWRKSCIIIYMYINILNAQKPFIRTHPLLLSKLFTLSPTPCIRIHHERGVIVNTKATRGRA